MTAAVRYSTRTDDHDSIRASTGHNTPEFQSGYHSVYYCLCSHQLSSAVCWPGSMVA